MHSGIHNSESLVRVRFEFLNLVSRIQSVATDAVIARVYHGSTDRGVRERPPWTARI
jgi:hypothetical protein